MRVLSVTSNDLGISWGPAIHYLELWNEFVETTAGDTVTGLAPSWTRANPIIAPQFSLKVIRVPNVRSVRQIIFDAVAALLIMRYRRSYDLAYIRLSHWHWLQSIVLVGLRVPYVLELNGLSKEDSGSAKAGRLRARLISLQERLLVRHAKLCITVSEGISQALEKRFQGVKKVVTIRNGVASKLQVAGQAGAQRRNVGGFLPPSTGVYVGTFTPWDGASEIVSLASRFKDIDFLMIGDGPGRKELQSVASPNVQFLGSVQYEELAAIYAKADFGIVLYEYERHLTVEVSSLKTLEYVASRLPIFSTAVRGQEFISERGFGRLVARGSRMTDEFDCFLSEFPKYLARYDACDEAYFESLTWRRVAVETRAALRLLEGSN